MNVLPRVSPNGAVLLESSALHRRVGEIVHAAIEGLPFPTEELSEVFSVTCGGSSPDVGVVREQAVVSWWSLHRRLSERGESILDGTVEIDEGRHGQTAQGHYVSSYRLIWRRRA